MLHWSNNNNNNNNNNVIIIIIIIPRVENLEICQEFVDSITECLRDF